MTETEVKVGDIWKPHRETTKWFVLSVRDNVIKLEGPSPKRQPRYVEKQELLINWDLLKRRGVR